ncbi:MAG: hypothetical protein OEU94_01690 [Aquincola sp.]|nr:hypothetical protein [Aquincola sp.]MDH4288948.1 hypothetical protein [Aquincola sp.]
MAGAAAANTDTPVADDAADTIPMRFGSDERCEIADELLMRSVGDGPSRGSIGVPGLRR